MRFKRYGWYLAIDDPYWKFLNLILYAYMSMNYINVTVSRQGRKLVLETKAFINS